MDNHTPQYELGLVLGGGGARGFAHLGAIKALQEAGIKPDIISGTSAGAIVGAMIAAGHSVEECMEFFIGKKVFNFARPTVSKMGLMVMHGMEERLTHFLQVDSFEKLKIPLVVTAGDINASLPIHFEKGKLIPAILASSSIPVIFIPTNINGIDYVDGGVFMNLPVRPIRERCKKIIAIAINPIMNKTRVTNIIDMAERSFHLSIDSNTRIDSKMADWLIKPANMSKYGIFDLDHTREIYNEGYRSTVAFLRKNKLWPTSVAGNDPLNLPSTSMDNNLIVGDSPI